MELKKVSPRHEAIMRRLVMDGVKQGEVAIEFDMTESNLSIIRSSPVWQERENEMKLEAFGAHKEQLNLLVEPAITALSDTVTSEDEGIKLRSAKEILDRTGFVPGMRIETDIKPVIRMFIPKSFQLSESIETFKTEKGDSNDSQS